MEKEAADLPGIWRAAALNSSDGNGEDGEQEDSVLFPIFRREIWICSTERTIVLKYTIKRTLLRYLPSKDYTLGKYSIPSTIAVNLTAIFFFEQT
jgi:hypothetical protein